MLMAGASGERVKTSQKRSPVVTLESGGVSVPPRMGFRTPAHGSTAASGRSFPRAPRACPGPLMAGVCLGSRKQGLLDQGAGRGG